MQPCQSKPSYTNLTLASHLRLVRLNWNLPQVSLSREMEVEMKDTANEDKFETPVVQVNPAAEDNEPPAVDNPVDHVAKI